MDRKISLVGSFSTDWIRYSAYELKENEQGDLYIVPSEGAVFTMYNPFDVAEELLIDTLRLGDAYKHYLANKTDKGLQQIKGQVLIYARKYGLFGLMSSSTYNRDIIGDSEVLLMAKNELNIKERILPVEEYMKLFTPFAEEGELSLRHYRNSVDLVKREDSPKYYGKRPMVIDLIFSRFYAERLEWVLHFAAMLSEHFNQLVVYKKSPYGLTEPVTILADQFKTSKIGFTIQQLDQTVIAWEFDSLKTTIQTIYAFAVTDKNVILSRCEHCQNFYIALSPREKYCDAACRNRSNVQKSRKRKQSLNLEEEDRDETTE